MVHTALMQLTRPLPERSLPPTRVYVKSLPPLQHQEGMIDQPELYHPMERRNDVPNEHAGRRTIHPCDPSWVREDNPGIFERKTSDNPPGDLCRAPLKEGWEEGFPQRILHHLEGHLNIWGGALNKGPLRMEVILQDSICGLRVTTREPGQGFH